MSIYEDIFPPVETVLDMEPEELAPLLLKYLSKVDKGKLNKHNFSLGSDQDFIKWVQQYQDRAMKQLIIAWMWLERELFIAPEPGNVSRIFITQRGKRVLESQDLATYIKGYLLPSDGLDPILVRKAKQSFIRGDYDTAIFQAFKEVEVRVREKAKLSKSDIGVNLMRKAFSAENGILTDQNADNGEKVARMELFAGAIGIYKNPNSHRYVNLEPNEAADIIHFANQLLSILDSINV